MTVLLPMLVFWVSMVVIYTVVVGPDRLHLYESVMVVVLLVVAVLLARMHVTLTVCLLVAALAFVPTIVLDELVGARKRARVLAELGD